jgi:hypothetical protein
MLRLVFVELVAVSVVVAVVGRARLLVRGDCEIDNTFLGVVETTTGDVNPSAN